MFALYEDEIFYSGVARLQKRLPIARVTLRSMFGFGKFTSFFFLPPEIKQTGAAFFLERDVRHLREKHCTSPFYMTTDKVGGLNFAKRNGSSALRTHQRMHLCAACADDDIKTIGETYWRRSHQLPAVSVCWKHNTQLIALRFPVSPTTNFRPVDATDAWREARIDPSPSDASRPQYQLAVELRKLLLGQYTGDFRTRALHAGYEQKAGTPDFSSLESEITAFFGAEYLTKIGAELRSGTQGNWTRLLCSPTRRRVLHPTYHALFEAFLRSKTPSEPVYGAGPWRCPLPIDHGGDPYPVKVLQQRRERGILVAKAICSCGTTFTTRGGQMSRQQPLQISTISKFGPELEAKIHAQSNNGSTRKQIAASLKIPFNAVVRARASKDPHSASHANSVR